MKQICDINGDINFCHGDLGATLAVIIDMEKETSVIFSACIAVFYTLFGGLYSVAYTDVIQLFCIFIGLWMCIPFAWTNPHVKSLSGMEVDWIGEIGEKKFWFYVDYGLLLVFGGIPWQVRQRKRFFYRRRMSKPSPIAGVLPAGVVEQDSGTGADLIVCGSFRMLVDGHPTGSDWRNCQSDT
jgi:hypothetical protein